MTREQAARFAYGSAGAVDAAGHVTAEEPRPAAAEGAATAEQLKALADFVNARREQERRDKWRHEAGLDGNQHGQIINELEDTL